MNRHQLATLAAAAAQYRHHVEHQQRLRAAINEGRIAVPALRVFEQRPAPKVRKLSEFRFGSISGQLLVAQYDLGADEALIQGIRNEVQFLAYDYVQRQP